MPPRELQAVGKADEVWLSWTPGAGASGQYLYRRLRGSKAWKRVTARPLAATCRMFCDRPARPGEYEYAVTALAADGWESPHSHTALAICGPLADGPRLVACKPFSRMTAGRDLPLRVVALSDRGIAEVTLCWRAAGERTWRQLPLERRFRDSYAGVIPGAEIAVGTLEFYVTATDGDGNRARWPQAAPALPWSITIAKPAK